MKYYKVNFQIAVPESLMQDARDMLSALAGEAGFETFEETETGVKGYVQQTLFDEQTLKEQLQFFPFTDATISYEVTEAEDRDWNEQWENEGFDPIIVGRDAEKNDAPAHENSPVVMIHDGRHLPAGMDTSHFCAIEIDAHMAFGTGTHETTRMMVASLLSLQLKGKRVLDCGCGTGILGIAALKLGAAECVGYDIDEWSADNARHNAVINLVDQHFTSLLGDVSVLDEVDGKFDVVLANINRNILLNDMLAFREKMNDNAILLLSGFYQNDIPLLQQKASTLGLTLVAQRNDEDWACVVFA
jgi:ribosomal protein L11 methyltransferase